jgi:hypothetical protein
MEKYLDDSKSLEGLIGYLLTLYLAGEKDPLVMSDAEFNNFCSLISTTRAQLETSKKLIKEMDHNIAVAEAMIKVAKFVRGGGMNDGSEED